MMTRPAATELHRTSRVTARKASAVPRRFLIVHNPVAGLPGERRLTQVMDHLRRLGCELELCRPGSRADNQRIVSTAVAGGTCDAVIVAGGDGTVRAAASALLGTGVPLGIIPVGTGNVMAHEIGLALDANTIATCLADGAIAEVAAAYANQQPFFLMAGAGFDGRVIGRLDLLFKRRVGKLAYAWPMTRGLISGPDRLCVMVDGREHRAAWCVATLRRRYAGSFLLAPVAQLNDTRLHVVLFRPANRLALISQLLDVAAGRIMQRRDIEHITGTSIEITSDEPVPVQIDGEPFSTTPLSIKAAGAVLRLIVPRTALPAAQSAAG